MPLDQSTYPLPYSSLYIISSTGFQKCALQLLLDMRQEVRDMKQERRDLESVSCVSSFSDSDIDYQAE